MRPRFASEAVLFLILAAILAAGANAVAGAQRKLHWVASYEAPTGRAGAAPAAARANATAAGAGKAFPPHPEKAWLEISGDDAAALFSTKTAPFLDARRTSVYAQGHVPGARPFSVWESDIDAKVQAFFQEGRDQGQPIVVYCSGGDCEDSHTLAQKLYFVGFDNVLVYKDGFPDWQKRNLPIATGDAP